MQTIQELSCSRSSWLEYRVDKRSYCRAFGEHDEAPEDGHHNENGYQPIFLWYPQKRPELAEEPQHRAQNRFFMDSGAGPGGILSIQYLDASQSRRSRNGSLPSSSNNS